jgi:O-antigen/teichoic acid export membrane protein
MKKIIFLSVLFSLICYALFCVALSIFFGWKVAAAFIAGVIFADIIWATAMRRTYKRNSLNEL